MKKVVKSDPIPLERTLVYFKEIFEMQLKASLKFDSLAKITARAIKL